VELSPADVLSRFPRGTPSDCNNLFLVTISKEGDTIDYIFACKQRFVLLSLILAMFDICVRSLKCNTIEEFNVDSKADYSALSSTSSLKKPLMCSSSSISEAVTQLKTSSTDTSQSWLTAVETVLKPSKRQQTKTAGIQLLMTTLLPTSPANNG